MNSFNGIGIIGTDLLLKKSKEGVEYLRFSLGVGDYNGKTKEKETDWIQCVVFGKRAQVIKDTLEKGSRIGISGKLKTTRYEKSKGVWIKYTTVIVRDFFFCEKKSTLNDWDFEYQDPTLNIEEEEMDIDILQESLGADSESDLPF